MHSQSHENISSNQNRTKIKSKRQSFRKQIRKSIVDSKLSYLRKTLIIDANLSFPLQTHNSQSQIQDKIPTPVHTQSENTITDLLKVLQKFRQKQIKKCQFSQIKKFAKKLDAAVLVLAHLDKLITNQHTQKNLEQGFKKLSINQIKLERQTSKSHQTNQQEEFELLKPIIWQKQPQLTKLEILKQVWQLIFLNKVDTFLFSMDQLIQSSNHSSQMNYTQLIPLDLIKWLYFCEQNMKHYMYTPEACPRMQVNSSSFNMFATTFRQSYFEVSLKLIQFLSLGQINEIFFNPLFEIDFMKNQIDVKIPQVQLELQENYISCSPFQHLIHGYSQSQYLLEELRKVIKAKIQQHDKWLTIQHLKLYDIKENACEYLKFLQTQENQLLKSNQLLELLSKHLDQVKNLRQIQPSQEYEPKYFQQDNWK